MPFKPLEEQEQEPRKLKAVVGGAGEKLIDNVLGVPNTIIRGMLRDFEPPHVLKPGGGSEQLPGYRAPTNVLNLPGGREVLSRADAMFQGIPFEEALANREGLVEQHPSMTTLGNVLGDAAMIGALRRPVVRSGGSTDILAPKIQSQLDKVFKPEISEKISRAIGRMGEGAAEAGVLAELEGADPVAAAGYAAGLQAAGLAGLAFSKVSGVDDLAHLRLIKGGKKFMGTAFAIGGLLQFAESGIPGDTEGWIQSVQAGFDKMIPLMLVGAAAASTGAGRTGGDIPLLKGNLGMEITDALSSIPRTAWNSAIVDMVKSKESRDLMERFVNNPQSMTDTQLRRFMDAFEKGEIGEMSKETKPKGRYLD